jgi:hypothetical protein
LGQTCSCWGLPTAEGAPMHATHPSPIRDCYPFDRSTAGIGVLNRDAGARGNACNGNLGS